MRRVKIKSAGRIGKIKRAKIRKAVRDVMRRKNKHGKENRQ